MTAGNMMPLKQGVEFHLEAVEGFLDMGAAVMGQVEVYREEQRVGHLHQELQPLQGAKHEVQAQGEGQLQGLVKGVGDDLPPLGQREDFLKS